MDNLLMATLVASPRLKSGTVLVNSNLANKLNLINEKKYSFFVGLANIEIIISISDTGKNKNNLYLSPVDLRKLYTRAGRKYGISKQNNGIHIGPVIGVMADTYKNSSKPFGGQSFFIKQLILASRKLGEICYGFSPFNINWNKKIIYGYTFTNKGWVKRSFPLPDIVYPREGGYSPVKRKIRSKLQGLGCKFINPPLIGKWQTYKIISKNENMIPHIPDTRLMRNFRQVDLMLNKYKAVYLKPVAGSMGRNIIKVVKRNRGSDYEYHYQINKQMHSGKVSTINELRSSLRRVMRNKTYIIQRQINLLHSQGSILDVRVMMQKDHTGEWSVTGKACRIGKPGSITSNISAGGYGRTLDAILSQHFKNLEMRNKIAEEVKMVATEAARTLDSELGDIGELGIDIGIDTKGRTWFIEANLRPARQVFILIGEKATRRRSIEKPLLYSRYLAGF